MDRSLPRLLLIALALVVLGVVLVAGATSTSAFATHNPSWDGTAEFRSLADEAGSIEIARNVSAYERGSANGTVAVILSPSRPYGEDAAAIRDFLERGGTVLVAEDYRSNADPLLSAIGASVRFDGRPVRDERHYQRAPTLAEASVLANRSKDPLGDRSFLAGVETLVLNRGTVLDPGNATVLARTSSAAYVDADGDDTLDESEVPARRPVLAVESVGDGRVIALSDPSVFINSMLEYGDNREFSAGLAARYDRVLFDVSHAPRIPPLAAAVMVVRESLALQLALGGLSVLLLVGRDRLRSLLGRLRRRAGAGDAPPRSPIDPDEVATAVSRDHPDWDESRIERVTEGAVGGTDIGTRDGGGPGDQPADVGASTDLASATNDRPSAGER